MNDIALFKAAPRRDEREEAFRRYELHIAKACVGSYVVDVTKLDPPLKPNSFISGFNGARRGFRLYNYTSKWIPANADLGLITPIESACGTKVLLKNKRKDLEAEQVMQQMAVAPGTAGAVQRSMQFFDFDWGNRYQMENHREMFSRDKDFEQFVCVRYQCRTLVEMEECEKWLKENGLPFTSKSVEKLVVTG